MITNNRMKINFIYQIAAVILIIFFSNIIISTCTRPPELKPGIYVNNKLNFTVEFPEDWVQGEEIPDSELHMMSPDQMPDLVITILKINSDLKNAPEEWINLVKMIIPLSHQFKISTKRIVTLNNGAMAVKARISWTLRDMKMMTSFLAVDKGKKRIFFQSTGREEMPFKVMQGITDSFRFN